MLKIGQRVIGYSSPCYIVAEIGINHNGDLTTAAQMIEVAAAAGCDAVKFQKRTVSVVYSPEELKRPRQSPFGTTNGDLKYGLEFGLEEYKEIFSLAHRLKLDCAASVWDEGSVDFMEQLDPPFYKIPSSSLTDQGLLKKCRQTNKPLVLSTGMSTLEQITTAIDLIGPDNLILLHCTSAYPCPPADINLKAIDTLKQTFSCLVGYSGHEEGILPTIGASAMGCVMIERHITLSRELWGSDQPFSIEPTELSQMVREIRHLETARGDGELTIRPCEQPALEKLRRSH